MPGLWEMHTQQSILAARVGNDLGSIEVGKIADLIAVDPLTTNQSTIAFDTLCYTGYQTNFL
ncbi:hypothetical protein GCM10028810_70540 [Spirosoma litoris]